MFVMFGLLADSYSFWNIFKIHTSSNSLISVPLYSKQLAYDDSFFFFNHCSMNQLLGFDKDLWQLLLNENFCTCWHTCITTFLLHCIITVLSLRLYCCSWNLYSYKQKAIMIIEPDPPLVYCGNSPARPPTPFHAMNTSKDNWSLTRCTVVNQDCAINKFDNKPK